MPELFKKKAGHSIKEDTGRLVKAASTSLDTEFCIHIDEEARALASAQL